jgi:chromosome segregation ATPase
VDGPADQSWLEQVVLQLAAGDGWSTYDVVAEVRSWSADVLGLVLGVFTAYWLLIGKEKLEKQQEELKRQQQEMQRQHEQLQRQQELLEATRAAVGDAIADVRGRYLAALLADTRATAVEFVRACRDAHAARGEVAGDRLRSMMMRLLTVAGLSDDEVQQLNGALDDVRTVHNRIKAPPHTLNQQHLKALDKIVEVLDTIQGRRAVPALAGEGEP